MGERGTRIELDCSSYLHCRLPTQPVARCQRLSISFACLRPASYRVSFNLSQPAQLAYIAAAAASLDKNDDDYTPLPFHRRLFIRSLTRT